MITSRRFQVALLLLFASSELASAQSVECKKTETQAECHARLKCRDDEELEQCQQRLRKERAGANDRDDEDRDWYDRDDRDDRGDRNDRDDRNEARDRRGRDGEGRGRRGRDRRDGRGSGRGRHRNSGRGFQANKTFGLGLELGEPTGLNGKYFVSDTGALDFGVGYIYSHYYYGDGVHLYLDYLWHPASLASNASFELPFYIGVGGRFWDFEYCDRNLCDYGGSAIGLRVPIGLSFDFNNAPLDIFLQVVPVFDFITGDYYDRFRDRSHFGADFSVGLRFWFK